jgi:phosphoribosyl 1,2-cyclic phosphodiesterase
MKFMTIRSGSNANCIYISNGNYGILMDAGVGIRNVQAALKKIDTDLSHIAAIFITHEHIDHIRGLSTITKKYKIPIFANAATCDAIHDRLPDVDCGLFVELPTGRDAVCPDLKVTSYKTSHDAIESVGYTVTDGKRRISIATDLGVVTQTVLEHVRCSDAIILESNYDENMLKNGIYPPTLKQRILSSHGHLSNDDCAITATALVAGGTKRLILGHLSENNNLPMLAYNTTLTALENNNIKVGRDVLLSVASREICSEYMEV